MPRVQPTVILMDIRMPELDGLEATRRIIAADDNARILILTTFGLDEYVYEALRAGANGFVLKDDPPEQLIAAVHTVAAGDALLSPAITKRVIRQFTRIPRSAPPKELDELTAREQDILLLIAGGLSNSEIGRQLYISETTVKTHVTHILEKLGLRDRVQAVVLAYQAGSWRNALTRNSPRRTRHAASRPRHCGEHVPIEFVLDNPITIRRSSPLARHAAAAHLRTAAQLARIAGGAEIARERDAEASPDRQRCQRPGPDGGRLASQDHQ